MTSTIAERVRRYILDGSEPDLQRLLQIAEVTASHARDAFTRLGVAEGWSAIECGCGPIGALAVLAEAVGPTGRVVGIDFNESTVTRARSVVGALDLDTVEVFVGDVNDLDIDVGGPFDLAFTRLFLLHQADPGHTLTQIAGLLRPGGLIVAQEPLLDPVPRSHPHLDALGEEWALLADLAARLGALPFTAERLPELARGVGLDVVSTAGWFSAMPPQVGFEIHAASIAASKERAVEAEAASAEEVDALVERLRAAKDGAYDWVTSPFMFEVVLRKPES